MTENSALCRLPEGIKLSADGPRGYISPLTHTSEDQGGLQSFDSLILPFGEEEQAAEGKRETGKADCLPLARPS